MWPLLVLATSISSLADTLSTELLPKVLYHVGNKKDLLDDEKNGITEEVWDKYIMGNYTRFGLVPYRRGLYGGANFDNLELYGNEYFGKPNGVAKIPWVMKIEIKEECLRPDAVTDLGADPKYLGWILSNLNDLARDDYVCLNARATDCRNLITGTQPVAYGQEGNLCDDVMQKFMADVNPRVVKDEAWGASWYLRDRTCIEKIEASPKAVLEVLADSPWDWRSRKDTYSGTSGGGYGTSAIAMLIGALADSPHVAPALLKRLREKTASSDIHLSFTEDSPEWVKETGPTAIDAYQRCDQANRQKDFGALAAQIAAEFDQITYDKSQETIDAVTKSLSHLCRPNGVRPLW